MSDYASFVAALERCYRPRWSADRFLAGLIHANTVGRKAVLDLGCGDASLGDCLESSHCLQYVGVDIAHVGSTSRIGSGGVPIITFDNLSEALVECPALMEDVTVVSSFSCHEIGASAFVESLPVSATEIYAVDLVPGDLPRLYGAIEASCMHERRADPRNALKDAFAMLKARGWRKQGSGYVDLRLEMCVGQWRAYADRFNLARGEDSGISVPEGLLPSILDRLFTEDESDERHFWWCIVRRTS